MKIFVAVKDVVIGCEPSLVSVVYAGTDEKAMKKAVKEARKDFKKAKEYGDLFFHVETWENGVCVFEELQ